MTRDEKEATMRLHGWTPVYGGFGRLGFVNREGYAIGMYVRETARDPDGEWIGSVEVMSKNALSCKPIVRSDLTHELFDKTAPYCKVTFS